MANPQTSSSSFSPQFDLYTFIKVIRKGPTSLVIRILYLHHPQTQEKLGLLQFQKLVRKIILKGGSSRIFFYKKHQTSIPIDRYENPAMERYLDRF